MKSKNNIYSICAQHMVEYHGIFPTLERVLDHIFLNSGGDWNVRDGLIYNSGKKISIDCYPFPFKKKWDQIFQEKMKNHLKDVIAFNTRYKNLKGTSKASIEEILEKDFNEVKAACVIRKFSDLDFSSESLYKDIERYQISLNSKYTYSPNYVSYIRVPNFNKYSVAHHLSSKSPTWLIKIAINLCEAHILWNENEIKTDHIWKPKLNGFGIMESHNWADLAHTTQLIKDLKSLLSKLNNLI